MIKNNKRILLKLKALFFTGAITAASLRGCTYGPPPVENIIKAQEVTAQCSETTKTQKSLLTGSLIKYSIPTGEKCEKL